MRTPRIMKSLALALPIALGAACASAPPPEEHPQPSATASSAPSASVAGPVYDLSPVAAPANVVVQAHAKSLSATMQGVGVNADLVLKTFFQQAFGKKGLRLDVDGDKLAAVVASEAPVDVVVALPDSGTDPLIAVAAGLRNVEDAKTALNASREIAPGMWAFGGEKAKAVCVVAAANGLVPARLICGPGDRDVKALGPWLARSASSIPSTTDATIDFDLKPIDAKYGNDIRKAVPLAPRFVVGQWGLGDKQFDKALETAAAGLANEGVALLSDLDKAHVDLTLSADKGVTLDGKLMFKGKSSWIAQTSSHSTNVNAPAMFFRLPADSASATFSMFHDPADYEGMKKVGKDAVEGLLSFAGIGTDAERKKVSALLDLPLVKDMAFVSGSGFAHVSRAATPKTDQEKFDAFFDAQTGWRLVGTNVKAETVTKWLRDAAAAYNQPGIQKEIGAKQKEGLPLPIVKTPAAPAKLGKGAFELDVSAKLGKDKNAPTLTFYVLVMADGDESWVAFGVNKDELVERLAMVKNGAPKEKTLDSRADVAQLKSERAVSLGYMTLDSFQSLGSSWFTMRSDKAGANWDDMLKQNGQLEAMLAGLPNKASTPIVYEASLTSADPLVSRFTLNVPKGTIADVAALIQIVSR
jgi:hypothetical protein